MQQKELPGFETQGSIDDILDREKPGAKALLKEARHIAALDGGCPDLPVEERRAYSDEVLKDTIKQLIETRGIEHYAGLETSEDDAEPFNTKRNYGIDKKLLNKLSYENLQHICFGAQYVKLPDEIKEQMTPVEILTFYESMGRLKIPVNPPHTVRTGKNRYEKIDDILQDDPVQAMSRLAQFGFSNNLNGYGALQRDQGFKTRKGDYKRRLSELEPAYLDSLRFKINKPKVGRDDKNRPIGIYDPNQGLARISKAARDRYMTCILKYL